MVLNVLGYILYAPIEKTNSPNGLQALYTKVIPPKNGRKNNNEMR
jgi:hypothetical protein